MGYAIAEVFADMGASVTLVSGPVNIAIDHASVKVIKVESALEMFDACMQYFPAADIAILAAAVADYRPESYSEIKIKKKEDDLVLRLVKNPDILATIGRMKQTSQLVIGFALENNNELENAVTKLNNKNADAIILNTLNDEGAGFQYETNQIKFIQKNGVIFEFPLKSKKEIAKDIASCVLKMI